MSSLLALKVGVVGCSLSLADVLYVCSREAFLQSILHSKYHMDVIWYVTVTHLTAGNAGAGADDGVLRWLEEFAARLAAGRYQVRRGHKRHSQFSCKE